MGGGGVRTRRSFQMTGPEGRTAPDGAPVSRQAFSLSFNLNSIHIRTYAEYSFIYLIDARGTIVILSRFFTRCPDLGGLVGDSVFDEAA
jgi:hypothetical protein